MIRIEKEHSGSGDVVLQLKLENQQLQEESALAKSLNESRQNQLTEMSKKIDELNRKLVEVEKAELSLKNELSEYQMSNSSLKIQLTASTDRCNILVLNECFMQILMV